MPRTAIPGDAGGLAVSPSLCGAAAVSAAPRWVRDFLVGEPGCADDGAPRRDLDDRVDRSDIVTASKKKTGKFGMLASGGKRGEGGARAANRTGGVRKGGNGEGLIAGDFLLKSKRGERGKEGERSR